MVLSRRNLRKTFLFAQLIALSIATHLPAKENFSPSSENLGEIINSQRSENLLGIKANDLSEEVGSDISQVVNMRDSQQIAREVEGIYQRIDHCLRSGNDGKIQCQRHLCHNNVTYICQHDVGKHGYVINEPGEYRLGEDIIFNPNPTFIGRAAITINSPNVFLSLNHKTLSQGDYRTPVTIGILVNAVNAVIIESGNITDFTRWGVSINPGSETIAAHDLNVLRCGTTEGTRVFIPEDLPTGGINAVGSQNLLFDKINAYQNFGTGIYMEDVQGVIIKKSKFNSTQGGTYVGAQTGNIAFGLTVFSRLPGAPVTRDVLIVDCEANGTTAGAIVTGIGIFSNDTYMEDIHLLNCQANNGVNGSGNDFESDATGIAVLRVNSCSLINCMANFNQHPFPPASAAFPGLNSATGFSINLVNSGWMENCTAEHNQGQGLSTEGIRVRDCNQVTVKNCRASNNSNTFTGTPVADCWGFKTDPLFGFGVPLVGVNIVFDSCIAQNNTAVSGDCGGFRAVNLIDSKFIGCISQGNNNFMPADPTLLRQTWGILVTDNPLGLGSANNLFEDNELQGNTIAGIEDQTPAALNAYIGNIARANGTNYVGLPTGTPIATWFIGSPPPPTTNIDNLDIRP